METNNQLTHLQLELLKLFSFEVSEAQIKDIKQMLAKYFEQKITEDKLFQKDPRNMTEDFKHLDTQW